MSGRSAGTVRPRLALRSQGPGADGGAYGRSDTDERDNIRPAIESAVSAQEAEIGLRICAAMTRYWTSNGDWTEGSEQLGKVLALSGGLQVRVIGLPSPG